MRRRKPAPTGLKWTLLVLLMFGFAFGLQGQAWAHEAKTSKGNKISHKHNSEFTEKQMKAVKKAASDQEKKFGDKIKRASEPSRKYNCAAFATVGNAYWLTKLGIFELLFDEGYRHLKKGEKPAKGDLVLYYKDGQLQHVGVVEEVDDKGKVKKVKSKWGASADYIHDPGAVPDRYGSPTVVKKGA